MELRAYQQEDFEAAEDMAHRVRIFSRDYQL